VENDLRRLPALSAIGARLEVAGAPSAVLINGTVGVGKTTIAEAVGELLTELGVAHAVIDVDGLGNSWSRPPDDPFNMRLGLQNLTSMTRNYLDAGMLRLVLAGVVEAHADRKAFEDALGVPLLVCRLRADLPVVVKRLTRRHGEDRSSLEWHPARAPELEAILDSTKVDDIVFDASSAQPPETAKDVLRALDWARGRHE